ncbi:MAG: hypothetical protein JW751_28005 [Polyangiaceae bacterium]|nr:hypothetical protein [Polyangiaceae bacterium]
MFRTTRTIASLMRHLTLGTAAVVATATLATTLVGCKDESQPEYWVDKLADPKWRAPAIKRLDQFYQDGLTKAGSDATNADVKALVDKMIEPLTKTYVENYADMDTKTRVSLIKLIASFRDKRTEPALKKALDEFVKKPTGKQDEQDIKWAIRAQGDLKLASLNSSIIEVFQKLKTSSMLGGITYKDLNATMLAAPDKAWTEPLKKMLEAEIKPPDQKKPESVDEYKDQLFWQTVSAQILGELREPSAAELLMKVILDPAKGDVAQTALLALVKIGQPSVDMAVKLLKGEETKLKDFQLQKLVKGGAKEPDKDQPWVPMAAIVLGMSGNQSAIKPILDVIRTTEIKSNRAVLLSELAKIPATAESKAGFQEGMKMLDLDVSIAGGGKALPVLVADSVTRFYDPTMVDWLIGLGRGMKAPNQEDLKDLRATILATAFKLARANQMASLKALMGEWGTKQTDAKSKYKYFEEPLFEQADEVLKACGDRVPCYLSTIEKSESQAKDTQFKGIKCAYMLAIHGDEKTPAQIVERLGGIENAAVRYAVASAIDYLLPKGSAEVADSLEKIIEANVKTADKNRIQGDAGLKQVMYRIRARAGK